MLIRGEHTVLTTKRRVPLGVDYGEERSSRIGHVDGRVLVVCYIERGDRTRIISARKANRREQKRYYEQHGT